MAEPQWELQKFIVGIRHERIFMVTDIQGAMADHIVALSKKIQVPMGGLKWITRPDFLSVIISDKTEKISVNCNADGIVIQADIFEDSSITIDAIQELFIRSAHLVLPLTEAKNRINRLGVVYEFYVRDFTNSAKTIFSQFTKVNLSGIPDNMLIRMSLKNPAEDSLIQPNQINDYKNVILAISSEREKGVDPEEVEEEKEKEKVPTILKISVDYQSYYIPPRDLKNVNISKHLSDAKLYVDDIINKFSQDVE
ncbi:MAG: hypothetical protein A4E64_01671 [Syntrophorhabdus sp. PtaU1.Bin058]|nr:MAG: hypothetical protein A4E64_01671 [Syntrophorhabdus sp. PtaU1.Bin058]